MSNNNELPIDITKKLHWIYSMINKSEKNIKFSFPPSDPFNDFSVLALAIDAFSKSRLRYIKKLDRYYKSIDFAKSYYEQIREEIFSHETDKDFKDYLNSCGSFPNLLKDLSKFSYKGKLDRKKILKKDQPALLAYIARQSAALIEERLESGMSPELETLSKREFNYSNPKEIKKCLKVFQDFNHDNMILINALKPIVKNEMLIFSIYEKDCFPIDQEALARSIDGATNVFYDFNIDLYFNKGFYLPQYIAEIVDRKKIELSKEFYKENAQNIDIIFSTINFTNSKNIYDVDVSSVMRTSYDIIKGYKHFSGSPYSWDQSTRRALKNNLGIFKDDPFYWRRHFLKKNQPSINGDPLDINYDFAVFFDEIYRHLYYGSSINLADSNFLTNIKYYENYGEDDKDNAKSNAVKESIKKIDGVIYKIRNKYKKEALEDITRWLLKELESFVEKGFQKNVDLNLKTKYLGPLSAEAIIDKCKVKIAKYEKVEKKINRLRDEVDFFIEENKEKLANDIKNNTVIEDKYRDKLYDHYILCEEFYYMLRDKFTPDIEKFRRRHYVLMREHPKYHHEPYSEIAINSVRKDIKEKNIQNIKHWLQLTEEIATQLDELDVYGDELYSRRSLMRWWYLFFKNSETSKSLPNYQKYKLLPKDLFKLDAQFLDSRFSKYFDSRQTSKSEFLDDLKKSVGQILDLIHIHPDLANIFVSLIKEKISSLYKDDKNKVNGNYDANLALELNWENFYQENNSLAEQRFWETLILFVLTKKDSMVRAYLCRCIDSISRAIMFINGVFPDPILENKKASRLDAKDQILKNSYKKIAKDLDPAINLFQDYLYYLDKQRLSNKAFEYPSYLNHLVSSSKTYAKSDLLTYDYKRYVDKHFDSDLIAFPISKFLFVYETIENLKNLKNYINIMENIDVYEIGDADKNIPEYSIKKEISYHEFAILDRKIKNKQIVDKYLKKSKNSLSISTLEDLSKKYQNENPSEKFSYLRKILSSGSIKKTSYQKLDRKSSLNWLKRSPLSKKLHELEIFSKYEKKLGFYELLKANKSLD